jgi:hypothetical protein
MTKFFADGKDDGGFYQQLVSVTLWDHGRLGSSEK